jgi:hypothetical protein
MPTPVTQPTGTTEATGATTARELLAMPAGELDALFRSSPAGRCPAGLGAGTAIMAPATLFARPLAALTRVLAWQGKEFAVDGRSLRNLLSPVGWRAVDAEVYRGRSRVDSQPCIVLDYSETSRTAKWVRDEIREVAPGLYLGVVFVRSRRVPVRFALEFADCPQPASSSGRWRPPPRPERTRQRLDLGLWKGRLTGPPR